MANQQKLAKAMESLETLKIECESSKKKMQDLEQEQGCSADDEELNKQSDSHAESETEETLELESLLELAQGIAKRTREMLGEFNMKMADHKKIEETLKNTKVELETSKSQVLESQQNIASLENLLLSTNEELAKVTNQKEALDAVVAKLKTEAEEAKSQMSAVLERLVVNEPEEVQQQPDATLLEHIATLNDHIDKAIELEKEVHDAVVAELKTEVEEAKSQSAILEQLIVKERQQYFAEKVEFTFTLDTLEEEKNLLNQLLKDAIDKVNGLESSPKEFAAQASDSHVKTIAEQHYKGIAAHESKLNDLQKTLAKATEQVSSYGTSIVFKLIVLAISVVFMLVVKSE